MDSDLGPGAYGVNYTSDLGPATFIAISLDLEVGRVAYDYAPGSSELAWLQSQISSARGEGDWIIVGMHKNCISVGQKPCEIGEEFMRFVVDERVDLVRQGHEHAYGRTHSLATVVDNESGRIANSGGDGHFERGRGTVIVIAGTAGRSMRPLQPQRGRELCHPLV